MKARALRKILDDTDYIIHESEGRICIGSNFVPNLISVHKDTLQLNYALDTFREGRRSIRYKPLIEIWDKLAQLIATGEIQEIIKGEDAIESPLPVFTYDDQYRIIESVTDTYGWPNTDIQGQLMYENTWFATEKEAISSAIKDCESAIKWCSELLNEKRAEIAKLEEKVESMQGSRARLIILNQEAK